MKAERIDQEFLELVNKHQPVIHKVCRMYADNADDRQDLFQETLYQLWRSYPSFKGRSNFGTWMYRIALNTAITALRRQGRKPEHVEVDDDIEQTLISHETLGEAQRTNLLNRAIQTLNPIERALVMLYLENLSYKEMSEILGLSENNVGVKLNRLKTKLQNFVRKPECADSMF